MAEGRDVTGSPRPYLVTTPVRVLKDEAGAIASAQEAAAEIAVLAADHRLQNQMPWRQAEILSQSGVTTIGLPKVLGGIGTRLSTIVETIRIISSADGGVGQLLHIHNIMIRGLASRPPGPLRDRLVADVLAGKRFGNAGAEVGGRTQAERKTRAKRNADGKWVVNGAKFYATGAYLAEWISSGANTDEGPIGFLVHRDTPGLFLDDDWDAFGHQHSVSGGVRFQDLVLEDEELVSLRVASPGGAGQASPPVRTGHSSLQILHAGIDTGIARGALEAATRYLREHAHVWIDADVDHAAREPMIVHRIGEYAIAVRVAESLLRDAGRLFDEYQAIAAAGGDNDHLQDEVILAVAAARAQSDHAAVSIGSDLFSLLGASSAYKRFNLNRFWGDARVHTTHDPIRWRIHHIGNYYLNGVPPDSHRLAAQRR